MENKRKFRPYEKCFKRLIDFLVSLIAILVLSPIFLIIIILELIFHGWPPFFCQYRPGRNGKVFKLYKFRSMSNKKDKDGNLLPDKDRITKFGKFIRKTGIDELPQLFNILKGDMSIIGPRPRLVKDMIFYDEDVISTYTARPGITCLSQINGGRSEASWEDIFEKDKEYVNNITFINDIKILFKTFFAIFKKEGQGGMQGESKRDYYYPDYLLKTNKINQEQYQKGIETANQIINEVGTVSYQKDLHFNQGEQSEQ